MTRTEYRRQLDSLRENVLEMGELVCDRLRLALEAYERADDALAADVVDGDHEINERYLDLEADCIELFALQQPVASDLRFVAASFKIVTDLERVGDLAANLAGYARRGDRRRFPGLDVVAIGREATVQLEAAMTAYGEGDAEATFAVADADDRLDDRCARASRSVIRDLVATDADVADDALYADVSRTLLTIRDLERVGDHAVNVAARTLYLVETDDSLLY